MCCLDLLLMTVFIVLIVLLIAYGCLFWYYMSGWKKLSDSVHLKANRNAFLSVIIPARNEEENIPALLNSLRSQTYPKQNFEVIVVDDFSTDATSSLFHEHKAENSKLIALTLAAGSKKKAIETGISNASGELVVCTDADCIHPPEWLQLINDFYVSRNAVFIAAPVKFSYNKSLLQIFQALDFLTLQGITAASVASGFHTMCNGANLAYKKQAFYDVNGFEGIDKVATGDDMLLMYKIWKSDPDKVFYLKDRKAITVTSPMKTWKDLFYQRKRWASKTLVYDDFRIVAVLAFIFIFNCFFLFLVAVSIFNWQNLAYIFVFWIAKAVIEYPFVHSVAKFYSERKLVNWLFVLQPLHIFYTVFVGISSQLGSYKWKGRKTK